MSGLRERNRVQRIGAILDATVGLLGTEPIDAVTTERIAERAGVAPATVYNLVGTRDELLHAVIGRVVDELVDSVAEATAAEKDPIAVAFLIVDQSVMAFTADSFAYRQIVASARTLDDGVRGVDPSRLQVAALREAQARGILRDDIDVAPLGRQVFIGWLGAMERWCSGRLDDEGFALAARHGLLTVLVAAASDSARRPFLDELTSVGARLERRWRGESS